MQTLWRNAIEPWLRLPFTVAGHALDWFGSTARDLGGATLPRGSQASASPHGTSEPLAERGPGTGAPISNPPTRENYGMYDTNLHDDLVKLVEFTIVSIQRDEEKILQPTQQFLETDDLTDDAFSNARVAEWVRDNTAEAKKVDLESVRVSYRVLNRWPKQDLRKDERTVNALEKIAEKIK